MSLTRRDVLRHGALVAGAAMIGPMALGARANRLDYEQLDATAMADLVRRGEASALELLNQALDRVEQWNPVLNAVVLKHYDRARKTAAARPEDRKSTRLNSSHVAISYAVFCLKKKKTT